MASVEVKKKTFPFNADVIPTSPFTLFPLLATKAVDLIFNSVQREVVCPNISPFIKEVWF